MYRSTATAGRPDSLLRTDTFRMYLALIGAGFRRYGTYRTALFAAMFANIVFGFLRTSVLLGVNAGSRGVGGYDAGQLATYVWVGQGLIGTVLLWAPPELADRIRSGEVVADLLRPVDPVWRQLANDLGWAGYGALTRFLGPLFVGAIAFTLYAPRRPLTYVLFVVSVFLAVLVSFGCRYLVNAITYWLLDAKGPQMGWAIVSTTLSGMAFPLWYLPEPVALVLYLGTPVPSTIQAPLDVLVERTSTTGQLGLIVLQAFWVVVLLAACQLVQRRAERRLVLQGG